MNNFLDHTAFPITIKHNENIEKRIYKTVKNNPKNLVTSNNNHKSPNIMASRPEVFINGN